MPVWRHLDLAVTAAAAVVIGVMGMLDLTAPGVTAGATLATLGVLTAAALAGRLQTYRLHETTTALAAWTRDNAGPTQSADRLLTPARPGTDVDLSGAVEIGIIGVTLARTLRHHLIELRVCLHRGGLVRIAVIDPAACTVAEAARRSSVPQSPEIFAHRLQSTIDLLRELAASAGPGRLEIRLLDFVPGAGLLMIDPAEEHAQVRVDVYSHRFAAAEPTLALLAGRNWAWYAHFRHEFEQIWSTGRPLPAAVAPPRRQPDGAGRAPVDAPGSLSAINSSADDPSDQRRSDAPDRRSTGVTG